MDQEKTSKGPLYQYRFGTISVDEARLELQISGLLVEIEQKPLRVLIELLRHANEVVTRDEMLDAVWGGRPTVPNVLTNAIAKLRRALGDQEGACVVTVAGVGYQLNAEVERTALGRRLQSRLQLKSGDAVPRREHYVLDKQIGASLGSEVWLARHRKSGEPLVYKFSPDGTRLPSLKREATLYRVLRDSLGERDDIVRIVDWNFEAMPYYLECEYCGDNLAQWAATDDQLARLSREERLGLFLKIAEAVAAAHSVGVLHRDLKPSNVLIAPDKHGGWQIRVGDFGSGRLLEMGVLEELGITQLGLSMTQNVSSDSRSGTPLYLATELIAGQPATVRSDVYALGIMLYQILAGDLRRPLTSDWREDVDDFLLRDDVAAATSRDPQLRISSAGELAARLRHLESRRIEQHRIAEELERIKETEQTLQKSKARRPWIILALGSLLIGSTVSLWLYFSEITSRRRAESEAARAQAINQFLNEDILGIADANRNSEASGGTIRSALDHAATRLDSRFPDDPITKASIYQTIGNSYFGISDYSSADKFQRSALSLFRTHAGVNSPLTLRSILDEVVILLAKSDFEGAKLLLDEAEVHPARQQSPIIDCKYNLHRAFYFTKQNKYAESLPYISHAKELIDLFPESFPNNDDTLKLRIQMVALTAEALIFMQRYSDARDLIKPVLDSNPAIEKVSPINILELYKSYGLALQNLGNLEEAEIFIRRSLSVADQYYSPDSFQSAAILSILGLLLQMEGRIDDAFIAFKRSYEITRNRLGEHAGSTLIAKVNLGSLEHSLDHDGAAIQLLDSALVEITRLYGKSNPLTQATRYYLAEALTGNGQLDKAEQMLIGLNSAAIAASEGTGGWAERIKALQAAILIRRGKVSEGQRLMDEAVAAMRAASLPEPVIASYGALARPTEHRAPKRARST